MASPKGRVVYRVLEVRRVRKAGDQGYRIRIVSRALAVRTYRRALRCCPGAWTRMRLGRGGRPARGRSAVNPNPGETPAALIARIRPPVQPTISPGSPARRGSDVMMACSMVGITARDCGSGRCAAGGVVSDCARPTSKSRTVLIQLGRTVPSGGRGDRIHSWRCCVPRRYRPGVRRGRAAPR